jgi:hypothetical protein
MRSTRRSYETYTPSPPHLRTTTGAPMPRHQVIAACGSVVPESTRMSSRLGRK